MHRYFCDTCGSPIYYELDLVPGVVDILPALFGVDAGIDMEIFWEHAYGECPCYSGIEDIILI
jgi:hypothetical protein